MIQSIKRAYRKFYKNLRFNLSANDHPIFIGFYKYFYRPSKGSLSEFLDVYSKSKKSKFTVVQIGANDGMTHDPIHKFIKRDRWRGVLLEPQKYVYDTFLKHVYQKHKEIHPIHAAIGAEDGETKLYKIGFSNMRWATGLASFDRAQIQKAFDSGLVADRCEKYQIEIPEEESKRIVAESIPVISANTLLKKYNIKQIDLLQIDTEGFDYQVIHFFDIAKNQPKAIIFENVHISKSDKADCYQLLKANEYVMKEYGSNTLAMQAPPDELSRFLD
ncbi:MAG: FkbM family methyltransferase [Bacteroidota bacterium]